MGGLVGESYPTPTCFPYPEERTRPNFALQDLQGHDSVQEDNEVDGEVLDIGA